MKHLITLSAIVVFAMVTSQVTAQSGGFNVKNVNASENVTVGSESDKHTVMTDRTFTLQPLTNSEIEWLPTEKGMLVYSTDSDALLVFDGNCWKRTDRQDAGCYLTVPDAAPCPGIPSVTDIDGNTYNTVLIGDQCWMKENLKVTHYPNGDAIPYITNNNAWAALGDNNTDDAYCYYNNNTGSEYGALYSYAAAIADNWARENNIYQGICPDGWHLPTYSEWTTLINYLEGESVAGGKMKEAGTSHWNSPNTGATNESGFTALPGGIRDHRFSAAFNNAGDVGYWWSATPEYSHNLAWYRYLSHGSANVLRSYYNKSYGFSVRCLRDD